MNSSSVIGGRPPSFSTRSLVPSKTPFWWSITTSLMCWMKKESPEELELREIRVRIKDRKKRTREIVVVTTLLDATKYSASALGDLFRQRWHAELDIRSIKTTMGMEMLRTKTPEMVRKEVGMHLLAYNLIRGVMAEAARGRDMLAARAELQWGAQTVRAFEETHLYEPRRSPRIFRYCCI